MIPQSKLIKNLIPKGWRRIRVGEKVYPNGEYLVYNGKTMEIGNCRAEARLKLFENKS